jgi:cell division septation protein DedD
VGTLREKADSTLWAGAQPPPERVLDCWAVFTVRFPAGADVAIRLSFRQEARVEGYEGAALYRFALQPAAGWHGTVGSTRVVFRAPWALTAENFPGHAFPIERLVDGLRVDILENEIQWTFPEMEPDAQADIVVGTMNPAAYSAINRGRMLYPGSRDADTWSRYALAAKQAVLHPRGFRTDAVGEQLYQESYEAYRRAVELRPWSAAWQAGFAELLCVNAAYPTFDLEWSEEERWQACARPLKAALDLNPQHELALRVLADYTDERYITRQDGRPAFPILDQPLPPRSTATPLPSATMAVTETPVVTETPLPTETPVASETALPTATEQPTGTATQVQESPGVAAVTAAPKAAQPPTGGQAVFLAALLPLAALIALIASLRKRK